MPDRSEIPPGPDPAAIVDAAIISRRSIRAFLPTPVPRETIEHILDVAARAPSGTNMQPWRVHALAGPALGRFTRGVQGAFLSGAPEDRDYEYYPAPFFEPYLSRRREVGWGLYSLLGIGRRETEKMQAQHARNFTFFDAPVGLICTIHRGLKIGSWLDFGMFLENIMIAARGRGLHTCPQAAFSQHPRTIRALLDLPEDEVIVCGMAIGHADPDAPEYALRTSRAPASAFTTFAGFAE
jgi:nitroreductase